MSLLRNKDEPRIRPEDWEGEDGARGFHNCAAFETAEGFTGESLAGQNKGFLFLGGRPFLKEGLYKLHITLAS
jgi:hypothetical protein